jgi:polyisoprenoid-binding protein YceI
MSVVRKSWMNVVVLVLVGSLCPLAAQAAAETYKIDPVHSFVVFRIKHLNISYSYGRFNEPMGTFKLDADDPAKSSFQIELKTQKVDTNSPQRDNHLRSPDFFNARQFPNITFKSTEVKKSDKGLSVTGDLICHGVTKSVTVELEQTGEGDSPPKDHRVGFEGVLEIKRSDFGMSNMAGVVGDDVRLMISLEGARPAK